MNVYTDGLAEGVSFYGDPEAVDLSQIDPLMRPIVERVNRSGWCWTAESCQGHPEAAASGGHVWAGNLSPMIRLVSRKADLGRMLATLAESMAATFDPKGTAAATTCRMYSWKSLPTFAEVLVYLDAKTVAERDAGLAAWSQFARLVTP